MNRPAVSIKIGQPYASRWIIKNEHHYFWDGEKWISDKEKALKFHNKNEAENKVFEFLNSPFKALNLFKYQATVDVEVFSIKRPDMDALIAHMWKTHILNFFFDDDGPSDSIVLPIIKWDTLREG